MKKAGIVCLLAVAFYFAVALPLHDRAKLQLEREKFEQAEKARRDAKSALLRCRTNAEATYNRNLHFWGTPAPGKEDVYNLPASLSNRLEKEQREDDAECQRQYELDLKAIGNKHDN